MTARKGHYCTATKQNDEINVDTAKKWYKEFQ
jgi:hypothetical protein